MTTHSVLIASVLACTLATTTVSGQVTDSQPSRDRRSGWELTVPGGTIVPTGTQRDAIKRANLTAIQLSYVARPALAITSTVGWARSRDITTAGDPKLDVFTYDVGAEVRAPRWIGGKAVTFSPFAGAGAGGRSYNYRKLAVDATHNLSAYGSVGGELGIRRIRLRLEARDYVSGFKPLSGDGNARTGNDVVVMAGVRFVSR